VVDWPGGAWPDGTGWIGTNTLEAGTPTDGGAGRLADGSPAPRWPWFTGVTGGISSSGAPAVGIGGGMLIGGYAPVDVAVAVLVGRIWTISNAEAPTVRVVRGATMYPAADRRSESSTFSSGTFSKRSGTSMVRGSLSAFGK
jgi:hypothetical protein